MDLINIDKNTYYIKGGTNTGVYRFSDNKIVLIDLGRSGLRVKKIDKIINNNNFTLTHILNTHEHDDHTGAIYDIIQKYQEAKVLSSQNSKLYIENPSLFSQIMIGIKTEDIKKIKVDKILEEGKLTINNEEFQIYNLSGHTIGSIGILTPDKVLFVGDALIDEKLLSKYDFQFIENIQNQLETLDKIENIDFKCMILGHGNLILDKEQSRKLIQINRKSINKYIDQTLEILNTPTTVEKTLQKIILDNELNYNYKEYHYLKTSLIVVINYLVDKNLVTYTLKNGELLYYNTQKQ